MIQHDSFVVTINFCLIILAKGTIMVVAVEVKGEHDCLNILSLKILQKDENAHTACKSNKQYMLDHPLRKNLPG